MRAHILKVTEDLFYREGIRAIGVDRIIAEAGIAKATLYSKFSSKHELVLAYLNARSERILTKLAADIAGHAGTSEEKILFVFDALDEIGRPESPFRGCAFMLALGENAGDVDIRGVALRHKARFRAVFESLLDGVYENSADLADQIAICYEGALTMLALMGDTARLPAAKRCVQTILAAAQRSTRPGPA